MSSLKRQQKEKVRDLISFTGASESVAIELLKAYEWQLDAAADHFFMNGGGSKTAVDSGKIVALFEKYKERDQDSIQISGIEKLCADLHVDPTDPVMLIIAWRMRAATMCVFTRDEWTRGFVDMGVDTIGELRNCFDKQWKMLEDFDLSQLLHVLLWLRKGAWFRRADAAHRGCDADVAADTRKTLSAP